MDSACVLALAPYALHRLCKGETAFSKANSLQCVNVSVSCASASLASTTTVPKSTRVWTYTNRYFKHVLHVNHGERHAHEIVC